MKNIRIYSKNDCGWCTKSKELMNKHEMLYQEYVLNEDYTKDELRQLINPKLGELLTVPQIFIDGKLIGGYNDFEKYVATELPHKVQVAGKDALRQLA